MAKNIDSMSNHELIAIAKALAECEMMKVDCANCPCCGVICGIGDIDDCMDVKDTIICEFGIRMEEMMNAN